MDQETRAFLEEGFRKTSQKIDGLREETLQKLDGLHGEIDGLRGEVSQKIEGLGAELREEMSQGLSGLGAELREEMSQGVSGLREEMSQGLSGLGAELREEMSQAVSGLREEMREGDRLNRVVLEGLRGEVKLVAEGLMGMSDRMARHEGEVQKSLQEMTMLLTPSYQILDQRVRVLEEWADRQARDVLEVIREKFGKRQSL